MTSASRELLRQSFTIRAIKAVKFESIPMSGSTAPAGTGGIYTVVSTTIRGISFDARAVDFLS